MTHTPPAWLNKSVLYQIYPRSFYDSSGDGIGDLQGIIQKLDYLAGKPDSLGVTAIWLSPFYPSPMADFGYDVSDYCNVDPLFGTLNDFTELLSQAHARGLKVIIDFVPNHTSDEHTWFKESRSSLDNPKRDWYTWRNARSDGSPPNNWTSVFGGSAWQRDSATGQYYLHSFLAKQPDLNWDNPVVREAMQTQMKFWLDKGVDGFRVDAVSWLSKDPAFRDELTQKDYHLDIDNPHAALQTVYSQNGPHLYEYLRNIAKDVSSYPERFMITEAYPHGWDNANTYLEFYRQIDASVCAPFNFEGIFAPWTADVFKTFIDRFQESLELGYVPIYCLGNHDRSRLASRYGPAAARTAAMLLLTLPGLPTIYYGDELGMVDSVIAPDQVKDPFEKNVPGKSLGRDPQRTPLAWNDSPNAGFTSATPWLPIHPGYQTDNITAQQADPQSYFNLYRELLALRRTSNALTKGDYAALQTPENIFGFTRESTQQKVAVLLNFSDQPTDISGLAHGGKLLFSTHPDEASQVPEQLRPHEGIIIEFT
jgi:alpha-glucosidase